MAEAQSWSPEQPPLLCLPLDTRQCRRTDCYLNPTAVPAALPKQLPEPQWHPGAVETGLAGAACAGLGGGGSRRQTLSAWAAGLQRAPLPWAGRCRRSGGCAACPPRPESDAKYSEYWQRARLLWSKYPTCWPDLTESESSKSLSSFLFFLFIRWLKIKNTRDGFHLDLTHDLCSSLLLLPLAFIFKLHNAKTHLRQIYFPVSLSIC